MREAADRPISKVLELRRGLALGDERGCVGLTESAHSLLSYNFSDLLAWSGRFLGNWNHACT